MEFLDWMVFDSMERERKLNNPAPEHYYLANIVMTIHSIFHKNPKSLKLEDFIIKFSNGGKEPNIDKAKEAQKSKSIWASIAGRLGFKKKEPSTVESVEFVNPK